MIAVVTLTSFGAVNPRGCCAEWCGIYATHMRSEGDSVLQSIDEAARIGREAAIPVETWPHLGRCRRSRALTPPGIPPIRPGAAGGRAVHQHR